MKTTRTGIALVAMVLLTAQAMQAQSVSLSPAGQPMPGTVDTVIRAESDRFFGINAQQGAFGKFLHDRDLLPTDQPLVVRFNRDVRVSFGGVPILAPKTDAKRCPCLEELATDDR
jgi:hypothetical protein